MSSSKRLDRLVDVVENCDRIARHVSGMSRNRYLAAEKTVDAVERCLQRISEAVYQLGAISTTSIPKRRGRMHEGLATFFGTNTSPLPKT